MGTSRERGGYNIGPLLSLNPLCKQLSVQMCIYYAGMVWWGTTLSMDVVSLLFLRTKKCVSDLHDLELLPCDIIALKI